MSFILLMLSKVATYSSRLSFSRNYRKLTMKRVVIGLIILGSFVVLANAQNQQISVTEKEAEWIGNKIFYNECSGKNENLVLWNKGENFISLGIGHFIWYPKDAQGPFDESFPKLLKFFKQNRKSLPYWLGEPKTPYCLWGSREEFLRDLHSSRVDDLRKLLIETKALQLKFIVKRLKDALPKILKAASYDSRRRIEHQFYRLAVTPSGMYVLIDYVNFNGEGILLTERYKGQGWGLLQVLERMKGSEDGVLAVNEFVQVAETLLTERVHNAPLERHEEQWLPGWKNRLHTYTDT